MPEAIYSTTQDHAGARASAPALPLWHRGDGPSRAPRGWQPRNAEDPAAHGRRPILFGHHASRPSGAARQGGGTGDGRGATVADRHSVFRHRVAHCRFSGGGEGLAWPDFRARFLM